MQAQKVMKQPMMWKELKKWKRMKEKNKQAIH